MKTFIYTLSDKSGNIRYVGKSNTLRKRLYSHINESKSGKKSYKISWIKSLISKGERPIIQVLDEVDDDNWQFWEQYWIDQMRVWGFNLTNLTDGGQGGIGYTHTEDAKNRMSQLKLGIKLSERHRKNISKSIKIKSLESPNYNRAGNNLKHESLDRDFLYQKYIIDNLSMPKIAEILGCSEKKVFENLNNYGIKKDKDVWKKQCGSNITKIVLQYDLSGNLIKEWPSAVSVYKNLKVKPQKCCRGIQKTTGGFIWRYKDEWFDLGN